MGHTTPGLFRKVTERKAWGVAAVTQRLADARFPCNKITVLRHFEGQYGIPWTEDRVVDVRLLFEAVDQDRFDDVHNVAVAIKRAADELGLGDGGKKPTGMEP